MMTLSRFHHWGIVAVALAAAACDGSALEQAPDATSSDAGVTDAVFATDAMAGYRVTVNIPLNGSGTVISAPAGIDCSFGHCSAVFQEDMPVVLTASPRGDSWFQEWSGACSSSGSDPQCSFTVTEPVSVTALFEAPLRTLTITVIGPGTVAGFGIQCPGDCSEDFANATLVGIEATAEEGATFLGFSSSRYGTVCLLPACGLLMDESRDLVATFE